MEYAIGPSVARDTITIRWLLLALPVYLYAVTTWLVRPLSIANIALAYVVPLAFVTGSLIFHVPKRELLAMMSRLRVELVLALVMSALSVLSLINSSEPFNILRVLFPSILPVLLFIQLTALRVVSPATVERLPRLFLYIGLFLGVLPLFASFGSGALDAYFFEGGYRFKGFFDHENQLSVMIATLVPLIIGEVAVADRRVKKWLWLLMLAIAFYTLIRVGSKTALFITLGYAWLFYLIAHARVHSALQNLMIFSVVAVLMIFVILFGREWADAIDPVLGQKINSIFSKGIENYGTIESRMEVWAEAWRLGTSHWIIGAGAGETILGLSHAHNLVLDYFRGIGVFGALAIILLCLRILWRAVAKTMSVLVGRNADARHIRIMACYASAAVYVLCNQLSNSFGPATISALWLIYIPAVMSDPRPERALSARPHRAFRA